MKKLIFIFLVCVHIGAAAQSTNSPSWRPVTYQKVILPTKIPEGILFSRHVRAGSADVHTLGYFIDTKTVREKVLPKDMYDQLLRKLRRTVFAPKYEVCWRFRLEKPRSHRELAHRRRKIATLLFGQN